MKNVFILKKAIPATLLFAGILFASMDLTGQANHNITVSGTSFSPKEITIFAGDNVIWENVSGSHNVNGTTTTYPSNPESFGNSVGTGWAFSHIFNIPGTYDYRCDPHFAFGMTGKITVLEASDSYLLTINFQGMTPHVGQDLWLSVKDQLGGFEIARTHATVAQTFSFEIPGIELGRSYDVDFFADFNMNGKYDAPPTDHAWRMELLNVDGNETLDFTHNTNFTDISWNYILTLSFFSMNPHMGQQLTLYVKDQSNGQYVDTVSLASIVATDFTLQSFAIQPGSSYYLDFFADHNGNGEYDAPPTDHAWRISLNNIAGDTVIIFTHNTNFTDIVSTSGIPRETIADDQVLLYPNPASDYLTVDLQTTEQKFQKIRIMDLLGKELLSFNYPSGSTYHKFNVSSFNPGLYLMQVKINNETRIFKFVVR